MPHIAAAFGSSDTARQARPKRECENVQAASATTAITAAQSKSWMTVSVTLNPASWAKMTGWASMGGSQRSWVSAAMRLASERNSKIPSVVTTMALGDRSASFSNTLCDSTWLISTA